jgi:restriction system protein
MMGRDPEVAARKDAIAAEKARQQARLAAQQSEAEHADSNLRLRLQELEQTLQRTVALPAFAFAALKRTPELPSFSPGDLANEADAPELATFLPPALSALSGMVPGAKRKHGEQVRGAEADFAEARQKHESREAERAAALVAAQAEFEQEVQAIGAAADAHNVGVDELERGFLAGEPDAVNSYYTTALEAMPLPYEPVAPPRAAYSPQSHQLVIELALPALDVIPEARQYRYVKARNETTSTAMPMTERRHRYTDLIAQLALSTLDYAFKADAHKVIESIVLNGHVHAIDRRTGKPASPCLVTVRVTPDRFGDLDLTRVDPAECLKGLSASLSQSPGELVPVRPVIEFDMADPRFITEQRVLDTLDTRPNLMELTPSEFESLITNLFEQMGLDTKLTQASRDGGVDCVAYDSRPILGGKVVIQAKRYKNTVGVSAVRDLFGTMQNEGATKGILVATSGYGQASHEFANGKPLELIDGGNLLYLLQEHAGIEARIEVPEDWVDPEPER